MTFASTCNPGYKESVFNVLFLVASPDSDSGLMDSDSDSDSDSTSVDSDSQ